MRSRELCTRPRESGHIQFMLTLFPVSRLYSISCFKFWKNTSFMIFLYLPDSLRSQPGLFLRLIDNSPGCQKHDSARYLNPLIPTLFLLNCMFLRYSSAFKAIEICSQNLSPNSFLERIIYFTPSFETSKVLGCLRLSLQRSQSRSSYCEHITLTILETCLSPKSLHYKSNVYRDLLFIKPSVSTCRKSELAMLQLCNINNLSVIDASVAFARYRQPFRHSLMPTSQMLYSCQLFMICSVNPLKNHLFSK